MNSDIINSFVFKAISDYRKCWPRIVMNEVKNVTNYDLNTYEKIGRSECNIIIGLFQTSMFDKMKRQWHQTVNKTSSNRINAGGNKLRVYRTFKLCEMPIYFPTS